MTITWVVGYPVAEELFLMQLSGCMFWSFFLQSVDVQSLRHPQSPWGEETLPMRTSQGRWSGRWPWTVLYTPSVLLCSGSVTRHSAETKIRCCSDLCLHDLLEKICFTGATKYEALIQWSPFQLFQTSNRHPLPTLLSGLPLPCLKYGF